MIDNPGEIDLNRPAYSLIRVEDTTGPIGASFGPVKRVYIKLFDGTDTFVDVPAASYNAREVAGLATKAALAHLTVVTAPPPSLAELTQG